jgi:hypothetical protein
MATGPPSGRRCCRPRAAAPSGGTRPRSGPRCRRRGTGAWARRALDRRRRTRDRHRGIGGPGHARGGRGIVPDASCGSRGPARSPVASIGAAGASAVRDGGLGRGRGPVPSAPGSVASASSEGTGRGHGRGRGAGSARGSPDAVGGAGSSVTIRGSRLGGCRAWRGRRGRSPRGRAAGPTLEKAALQPLPSGGRATRGRPDLPAGAAVARGAQDEGHPRRHLEVAEEVAHAVALFPESMRRETPDRWPFPRAAPRSARAG